MNQNTNKTLIKKFFQYVPEGYCATDDIIVDRGEGSYFYDIEGKKYLDFTSGIFTNTFGHAFPPLIKAEIAQCRKCDNIHGRRSLAELDFYTQLAPYMPSTDYAFIPYNDGGYTVDRGLSDIINYFNKERIAIAAFRGGFHGKTMGTKLTINETAKAALFENFQVDFPNCYRCPWQKKHPQCGLFCVKEICAALKQKKTKAILFEVIQGSGVIIPPQGFWQQIETFCQKANIIMFADEVLTGGGRTGSFLASFGLYGIKPDIISLTKGLANGRPLSVLCEQRKITNNPYAKRKSERSSTFAAHPTNMAVAAESLRCLKQYQILENVQKLGKIFHESLLSLKEQFTPIGDVRSVGLMGAIEFVKTRQDKQPDTTLCNAVFHKARQKGLETILSGHILRLAPPLNITKEELLQGLDILKETLSEEISHEQ